MKRIFHPWHKWECFHAGLFETTLPSGIDSESAKLMYRDFLANDARFSNSLEMVISSWPISCDHFLSNESINRIAWLGQASMCMNTGIPMWYRGGFKMLSGAQQKVANAIADSYLKKWVRKKAHEHTEPRERLHSEMEESRLF